MLSAYAKTKMQISCAVTSQRISTFVFATWIVQSVSFLIQKPSSGASHPRLCRSETTDTCFLFSGLTMILTSCQHVSDTQLYVFIISIELLTDHVETPILQDYDRFTDSTFFQIYAAISFGTSKGLEKGTSRQRSGKGAIRKRFPLQKPRWEKTKLTIRYLYHETIVSRMGSYFPNRWPLSYLNLTKNMKTYIRRQQHKKFFKHQDIKQNKS